MKNRILSVVMAVILCMSLAATVFATETAPESPDPDVYMLGDGFATRMSPGLFMENGYTKYYTASYLGKEVTVWNFPAETTAALDDWSYELKIYKANADNATETDMSSLYESGLPFVLPEAGVIYRFALLGGKEDGTFGVCKEYYITVGDAGEAPAAPAVEIKMNVGNLTGYVNGDGKTLDAAPIIRNDRTMLPVRFVAENLGATVGWDDATKAVTVTSADTSIAIVIGAPTATVNGNVVNLDSPAFISESRTYLPVRFVAESLGATVGWDAPTQTVTLTK